MALRFTYTILAPFYDLIVARASERVRAESLRALAQLTEPGGRILISGIGTGLDIPHLPANRHYVGVDITPAMLEQARRRARGVDVELQVADAMQLPFGDASFEAVVMHLILAVVPAPARALREAERVLRPGGHVVIVDKFLKPGERALVRRLISPIVQRLGTQTNVEFEPLVASCPSLHVVSDQGVIAGGWFRRIVLRKGW